MRRPEPVDPANATPEPEQAPEGTTPDKPADTPRAAEPGRGGPAEAGWPAAFISGSLG